jgi:hypothetical protein
LQLHRYYVSWRNAALNGCRLSDDALAHLQLYDIPSSGRLKLDYVSYQVRLSQPQVLSLHLMTLHSIRACTLALVYLLLPC